MNTKHQKQSSNKSNPVPTKTGNQAIDELVSLRYEVSEFRKDLKKLSSELSVKIAFGAIGALLIVLIFCGFIALLLPTLMMPR